MAYVIINEKHLEAIADAIRSKGGVGIYKPREMAAAIEKLSGGGGGYDGTGYGGLLGLYFKGVDVPGAAFAAFLNECVDENGLFLPEDMWTGKTILGEIEIPFGIAEIPAEYFKDTEGITGIEFPFGLATIGDSAFQNAINAPNEVILFGTGIENIGSYAFADNTFRVLRVNNDSISFGNYAFANSNIEKIELNNNDVIVIGDYAFQNNTVLTELDLTNNESISIGAGAFQNNTALTSVELNSDTISIGANAFEKNTALTTVTLEGNNITLGSSAFAYDSALTTVNYTLESVPAGLFKYCTALKNVTVSDSVTEIGAGAFNECSSLTQLPIPAAVEIIGANAYRKCAKDSSFMVLLPDSVKKIGDSAFFETNLTGIVLPYGLEEIGIAAFMYTPIREIVIPGSAKTLGGSMLAYCTNLERVIIGTGITEIPDSAFEMIKDTGDLYIECPYTLKYIGNRSFCGLGCNVTMKLNEGLETLENYAFLNARGLTSINLPSTLEYVGNYCFCGTGITNISFPASLKTFCTSAFYRSGGYGSKLRTIEFNLSPNHQLDLSRGGIMGSEYQLEMGFPSAGDNNYITFKGQGCQIPKGIAGIFNHNSVNQSYTVISVPWSESENPDGFPWGADRATIIYNNGL